MNVLLFGILIFCILAGAQWLVLFRIFERIDPQPDLDEHATAYDQAGPAAVPFQRLTYWNEP